MAQYINKEKVEEILRNLWKEDNGTNPEHRICYNKALQEVQYELDTIEVKDVKEVDLEKETSLFIYTYFEKAKIGHKLSLRRTAKHFFELGLNAHK